MKKQLTVVISFVFLSFLSFPYISLIASENENLLLYQNSTVLDRMSMGAFGKSYRSHVNITKSSFRSGLLISPPSNVHSKSKSSSIAPLMYISTDEGLLSHFRQLQSVWGIARIYHRNISTPYFTTKHFPGINISMCDIFELPSSITCLPYGPVEARSKYSCVNVSGDKSDRFNFESGLCIDGPIYLSDSNIKDTHLRKFDKIVFARQYRTLFDTARARLTAIAYRTSGKELSLYSITKTVKWNSISSAKPKTFVVIHWRRGDQLGYVPAFSHLIGVNILTSPGIGVAKSWTRASTASPRKSSSPKLVF